MTTKGATVASACKQNIEHGPRVRLHAHTARQISAQKFMTSSEYIFIRDLDSLIFNAAMEKRTSIRITPAKKGPVRDEIVVDDLQQRGYKVETMIADLGDQKLTVFTIDWSSHQTT